MSEGFIADQGYGTFVVPNWVEGQPKKSVWVGVQIGGKGRSEVSTWRCGRCGLLESYAIAEPDQAREAQGHSQTKVVLLALTVGALTLAIALGVILQQ